MATATRFRIVSRMVTSAARNLRTNEVPILKEVYEHLKTHPVASGAIYGGFLVIIYNNYMAFKDRQISRGMQKEYGHDMLRRAAASRETE